ncbi:cell envelope-related transcriptional attenuator [Rippkaea orientalis PCC 8801]|uniref:Cell envelope-related transcriptional attenuator n=1 Tax=Rippkaea orientalis (strain PCC 8801 / RF-1) TaxID=41431 RepID=B7K3Z2_RIPO1|nr:LCP family protein [Rippkaea orientalis]ACK66532.1 cell envelope-related transcriptional attenuator [Rippkaea orientalis PCC 8801]
MANSWERIVTGSGLEVNPVPKKSAKSSKHTSKVGNKQPLQSISPFYRGLLWGITFSCTAALSATVGASITLLSPLSHNLVPLIEQTKTWGQAAIALSQDNQTQAASTLLKYRLSRPVNVLVLGIDRVPDAQPGSLEAFAGRSDTMLLLRFDPTENSVQMLSIPRDSRVEIPGVGYTKINDANIHGGPALAARVISKTLNDVPIDRYVRVTTDAFTELVNLVGGVEVVVPHAMEYEDKTQKLKINLEAGRQILTGEQAEQFARFRKDGYGDIGRVQRQQVLLKALQQRIYSPTILPKIPQAISLIQQNLDTNLTWEEILALANFGRELQRENVKMVMLPGRFSQAEEFDARSYWILSQSGIDKIMTEYFNIAPKIESYRHLSPNRVRIALQNATDDPSLGRRMAEYLAKQNFHNVYIIQDAPQLQQETEIVVQQGDLQAAQNLQTLMGIGRVEASSTGDLDSQLTLRIGLDAKDLVLEDSFLKESSPSVESNL